MSSKEFVSLVRMNANCEYIAKGTKFSVYKMEQIPEMIYVCTVTVNRTVVKYDGDHPSDILTGDYLFIEQKN